MSYDNFKLHKARKAALQLRTKEAAYTLLEAYARCGSRTYPVDSALFMEIWPNGTPTGFVLSPYKAATSIMATHTVSYAEIEPRDTHTPGPWVVGNNGTILIDEQSDYWKRRLEYANRGMGMEGWRLARVEPEAGMGMSKEDAANARLIAAAPDLLAIVVELARYDGMSGDLPMLIVQARAALAKATTTHKE